MKQILACIFYFVSWDCMLLSREYSVAVMGASTNPVMACKKKKMAVMENGESLQGGVYLLFGKEEISTASSILSPLPVTLLSMLTPKPNSQGNDVAISSIHSPASIASTFSSVSFQEEPQQLIPLQNKRKLGDPTAAGRRKRRKF